MTVVITLAFILFIVVVIAYLFPLAVVYGNSMLPTYHEGEILLCRRVLIKKLHNYHDGDVYVCKAPYSDEEVRLIIKRVSFIVEDGAKQKYLYLLGDNPPESHDSRQYGVIHCNSVVAKVLFKIKSKG